MQLDAAQQRRWAQGLPLTHNLQNAPLNWTNRGKNRGASQLRARPLAAAGHPLPRGTYTLKSQVVVLVSRGVHPSHKLCTAGREWGCEAEGPCGNWEVGAPATTKKTTGVSGDVVGNRHFRSRKGLERGTSTHPHTRAGAGPPHGCSAMAGWYSAIKGGRRCLRQQGRRQGLFRCARVAVPIGCPERRQVEVRRVTS